MPNYPYTTIPLGKVEEFVAHKLCDAEVSSTAVLSSGCANKS